MKGRTRRIEGHTLVKKGWGHHIDYSDDRILLNDKPGGNGRALCTCGRVSPILPSQYKRNIWMREDHKPEVLEGMAEDDKGCERPQDHRYRYVQGTQVDKGDHFEHTEECAHCGDAKVVSTSRRDP